MGKVTMKRLGGLWSRLVDRENLREAVAKALRAKRSRPDARAFVENLDANLSALAAGLETGSFQHGSARQFVVHDPKERLITAPCFEERVLHHALMNVCEDWFDRRLINDSYACRVGRGRVAAVLRAKHFSRRHAYFLRLDIRRYFDSIPHDRAFELVGRLIKDPRIQNLFRQIITSHRQSEARGLPIGSLTSQHLANLYLDPLDRFVKESLRMKGYVRYMDDCVVWGDSTRQLGAVLEACERFVRDQLALEFKPQPYINRTDRGIDFLGCRVWRRHITLSRRSRLRFRRKLAHLERDYQDGIIDEHRLQQRATALVAFARAGGAASWRFRAGVIQSLMERDRGARTA